MTFPKPRKQLATCLFIFCTSKIVLTFLLHFSFLSNSSNDRPFTNPIPPNVPCLNWLFLPRQTRIHQQEFTFTGLRVALGWSWWVLAKHFLNHLQHLCLMISATTSKILHTAHQKASSFSIFFSKSFDETRLISLINKTGSTVPVTSFYG